MTELPPAALRAIAIRRAEIDQAIAAHDRRRASLYVEISQINDAIGRLVDEDRDLAPFVVLTPAKHPAEARPDLANYLESAGDRPCDV